MNAQFYIKGITADNTKYDYLILVLKENTIQTIIDVMKIILPNKKYKNIKRFFLDRFTGTEEKRLDSTQVFA